MARDLATGELTSFNEYRRLRSSMRNLRGRVDARLSSEDRVLTRRIELTSISRALGYCMGKAAGVAEHF
jgi:hypothetical protein